MSTNSNWFDKKKIIWKYHYAQISSIEKSHRSKEAPFAYYCSKDDLPSGCPKAEMSGRTEIVLIQ